MKAAVYCRLSDEDRNKANLADDSESIQNQKNLLVKYAAEQGWELYQIYSDDDYSGLDSERPEWNRMLKDAESGRFDIVLCKSQSRFTRDMELVEKYLHHKFIEWGIRFVGLTDNSDTLNRGNKKQRQIIGLTNEWYCEDVSENIKAVFDAKRKDGKFIGSFAAYGYRKDPGDRNRLLIDEEAAQVVRRIYGWYLEGYGTQHIALMLNERRIPNPTSYKRQAGLNFASSCPNPSELWNKTTVKRILKNELYIGNMVQGRRKKLNYKSKKIVSAPKGDWIIAENTHEPVIEKKQFDEIQRRINERQRSTGEGQAHIFSTKLRCADCGSTMNRVTVLRKNGKRYSYYRCGSYAASGEQARCSSHSIRTDLLEELVASRLRGYLDQYLDEGAIALGLQEDCDFGGKLEKLQKEARGIENQLLRCTRALKDLYYDRAEGRVAAELFIELKKGFDADRAGFKQKMREMEIRIAELKEKTPDQDRWGGVVKQYRDFGRLTRNMTAELIDLIEIAERNIATGEQTVRIHWSF